MSVDTGMEYDGRQVVEWTGFVWVPKPLRKRERVLRLAMFNEYLTKKRKLPTGVEILSPAEHDHYKALGCDYRYKKWSNRNGWLYW